MEGFYWAITFEAEAASLRGPVAPQGEISNASRMRCYDTLLERV